ncbi:MAG: hypothetical protein J07HX64_02458 [halophilic archaeon J07HX64]|nr:MAG: hypothetical protein J07HX64_02458 [halophilic archaeon J07HX64]
MADTLTVPEATGDAHRLQHTPEWAVVVVAQVGKSRPVTRAETEQSAPVREFVERRHPGGECHGVGLVWVGDTWPEQYLVGSGRGSPECDELVAVVVVVTGECRVEPRLFGGCGEVADTRRRHLRC